MSEEPSMMLILATRLRYIEELPFMAIMGLLDEFSFYDANKDSFHQNPFEAANHNPQWAAGPAFCLACQHEWAAVAETGTTQLDCPECKRLTGHWKFEFAPKEGTYWRVCDCGNKLFYLTPEGHQCASCGIYQSYD